MANREHQKIPQKDTLNKKQKRKKKKEKEKRKKNGANAQGAFSPDLLLYHWIQKGIIFVSS